MSRTRFTGLTPPPPYSHPIPFTLIHAHFNEQPSYATNYAIENTKTNTILHLIEINKYRLYFLLASFLLSHLCLYWLVKIICTVFLKLYWIDRIKRWSQYWNRILVDMDIYREIWIYIYHIQYIGWFLTEQQWYFTVLKSDRRIVMERVPKRLKIFTFSCNILMKLLTLILI